MTNPLVYVPASVPEDCVFKVSPSAFPSFIQSTHNWYRSEVLQTGEFSHNTSTTLGTIAHYCAEKVANEEVVEEALIEEYIDSLEVHDDYDPEIVRAEYRMMAETLVNDYVLANEFLATEEQVCREIKDKVYVAGTFDFLHGTQEDALLGDYKTYHSKTKPKSISQAHRYQLLCYAWALREYGYEVNRIRVVYINRNIEGEISEKTGKRLKSYPPEVTVHTETITQEDYNFIEGLLELCVDSLKAAWEHPELTHVIFHDPRLKVEN
jgi:hypothetical protein